MRDFKFFNIIDENDAIEPNLPNIDRFRELVDYQGRNEVDVNPTEPPQIYTQMLRMNVPMGEMTEDYLNHVKVSQERVLMENLSNTLDFRHEIISIDASGFTLRTELFI